MKINTTLILIIIILLLIGGAFLGKNYYENKLAKERTELKKERLRNDELKQISTTQARKLVADSLTQKQLNKVVDSLEIKLNAKPKVIIKPVIEIKEVDKPIDGVVIEKDTVSITDYYPHKEDPFITYTNKFSLSSQSGNSNWDINPFEMALVLSQQDNGMWQLDTKTPEYISITNIDVQATPLNQQQGIKDNFGWLIGGGVGKDFILNENNNTYYRLEGGIRINKFYIDLGVNTNISADAVIKFEF